MQDLISGIAPDAVKDYVSQEMAAAIKADDWAASYALLEFVREIAAPLVRAEALNTLLVMPGHELHQEITRDIQGLRCPSSVPYIQQILEGDFQMFDYTGSEPEVIAKWFSHALADIGTTDAIAVIRKFAASPNAGVAKEMMYRLEKLSSE